MTKVKQSRYRPGVAQRAAGSKVPRFHDKSKAVPLQAWSCPEVSRKLRFPDFMTNVKQSHYRPGVAQRVPGS